MVDFWNNENSGMQAFFIPIFHYPIIPSFPLGVKPQSSILDLLKEKGLYLNVFCLIFWKTNDAGR